MFGHKPTQSSTATVALALILVVGVAGACGSSPATTATTTSITAGSTSTSSAAQTTTSEAALMNFKVYLARSGYLYTVARQTNFSPAIARAAMTSLLAGPLPAETSLGISSAIPSATELLGVSIANQTATVNLSGEVQSGGGSLSVALRLAQITYTLTQFPSVSNVVLEINGQAVTVFGGEGLVIDHPMTRSDFQGVIAPIFVDNPAAFSKVSDNFKVSGTANVYEAVFWAQLIDPSGKIVFSQREQASSGTGTRGSFSFSAGYPSAAQGLGLLKVFDYSAKDGSVENVMEVPLHLN